MGRSVQAMVTVQVPDSEDRTRRRSAPDELLDDLGHLMWGPQRRRRALRAWRSRPCGEAEERMPWLTCMRTDDSLTG